MVIITVILWVIMVCCVQISARQSLIEFNLNSGWKTTKNMETIKGQHCRFPSVRSDFLRAELEEEELEDKHVGSSSVELNGTLN